MYNLLLTEVNKLQKDSSLSTNITYLQTNKNAIMNLLVNLKVLDDKYICPRYLCLLPSKTLDCECLKDMRAKILSPTISRVFILK